ncbi:MAG: hypothetical protein ACOC6F_01430 [bacterium]
MIVSNCGESPHIGQRPQVRYGLVLAVTLSLAAALHLWGLDCGLPYTYHPDGPAIVNSAVQFFRIGDLDPPWFRYPTLQPYIVAVVYAGCHALGMWERGFAQSREMPAAGMTTPRRRASSRY